MGRVGPDGLPARSGGPGQPLEPAGRRAQRAPAERREPAIRHRRRGAVPSAVPQGASVLRERDRIARRHPGGEARRREELLQAVLRAEQRQPRHRRRLRQGGGHEAGREVFRHAQAGPAGAEALGPDAADHRRAPRRRAGSGRVAARLHGVADAADLQGGRRRCRHRRDRAGRRTREPAVQEARVRAADCPGRLGRPVLADARLRVPDHGYRTARPHGRRTRKSDRCGAGAFPRRRAGAGRGRPGAQHLRNPHHPGSRKPGGIRRRRRSPEHLQPLSWQSRQSRERSAALPRDVAGDGQGVRAAVPHAGDARGRARRSGTAGSRRARSDAENRAGAERNRRRVGECRRAVAQGNAEGRRGQGASGSDADRRSSCRTD